MTVEAAPDLDHRQSVNIQLVGGPTVIIEIGGLRLLTDPTFDPPGDHQVGARVLVKTSGPGDQSGGCRHHPCRPAFS